MSKNNNYTHALNFIPHGEIEISTSLDKIIIYRGAGPFNKEFMISLYEASLSVLEDYSKKYSSWSVIIELTGNCSLTYEAQSMYEQLLKKSIETFHMQKAFAIVINEESEGAFLIKVICEKVYPALGVPYGVFQKIDDAIEWLETLE